MLGLDLRLFLCLPPIQLDFDSAGLLLILIRTFCSFTFFFKVKLIEVLTQRVCLYSLALSRVDYLLPDEPEIVPCTTLLSGVLVLSFLLHVHVVSVRQTEGTIALLSHSKISD